MPRSSIALVAFACLVAPSAPSAATGPEGVIQACANRWTGSLRLRLHGGCLGFEFPVEWAAAGPPGPEGPPGAAGSAVFLESSGAVTATEGGSSVEIPGLAATLPLREGSRLWVQGDFHEHRFCDGYLDRSTISDPWALDLELDGTVVASREIRGEQGNVADLDSKPFTWVSEPLAGGAHTARFLLRPPASQSVPPPPQAKVCLGTDGTSERQSRVTYLELPG